MASDTHRFIPNSAPEIREKILQHIGVPSVKELYHDIPNSILLNKPLKVDGFNTEQEVANFIQNILAQNKSANDFDVFLGSGIYSHYIPAVVKTIMARTEFQTSYTPYQAEISQGLLQALFEFQSMMCDLTGMETVNSSMYDGSTAAGEAVRMAVRATGKYKVLVPKALHPDKKSVLHNYSEPVGIKLMPYEYDKETGSADLSDIESKLDENTAAVYFETPTFFGILDSESTRIPELCHTKDSLAVQSFDPVSLGGLKPPGEYDVDIVVGEGQSISVEPTFGGPLLGIIGCRTESLLRQMPGRLIGLTGTIDGRQRAFSMVLQTREQHIRRERATSNICTNEALLGVGAAVYLSLMGPKGLHDLFETILAKTNYMINQLSRLRGVTVPRFKSKHYQEFVATFETNRQVSSVNSKLVSHGIHGGRNLAKDFPELGQSTLFCVNEMHTVSTIDHLRTSLETILQS